MRALVLTAALLGIALPARAGEPSRDLTQVTAATERLVLRGLARAPRLAVDAVGGTLELVPAPGEAAALERALSRAPSTLCPVRARGAEGAQRLVCRTHRLWARLVVAEEGVSLDVRELRGLPWRAGLDAPPRPSYAQLLGASGACPGATALARGECALASGRTGAAQQYFREALEAGFSPHAALRLGDLALQEDDPAAALGWYRAAGVNGPFGRMAAARTCELTGACFGKPDDERRAFDDAGLPEPLRTEAELRAARRLALAGRPAEAAQALVTRLREHGRGPACDGDAEPLCRRVALAALESGGEAGQTPGLALYGLLTPGVRGPLALELARAAADAAAALGAPTYAATVLSFITGRLPRAELGPHLLRTARLFLDGGDRVRARVLCEYAQTRLPRATLRSRPWRSVLAEVRRREAAAEGAPGTALPPPALGPLEAEARARLEQADAALTAARAHRRAAGERPEAAGEKAPSAP